MAPVVGCLPRSLWPQDVVVWVRSSAQRSVRWRQIPQGSTTKSGEVDPKTIRGFQRPITLSATQADDTPCREPIKTHSERRRADEAHSDGLRQQSKIATTRSVGGRTTHDKTITAERPVDQLSQEEAKGGGIGLTPRKAAPLPTTRSKNVWSIFPPIATRPTHTSDQWGAHDLPPPNGVGNTGSARWEIAAPTTSTGGQIPSR